MTTANFATRIGAKALQTRWFVRAPIRMYSAGLGFVFGSRVLMLQHTGRTTGAPRFVVLEVIEHPAADEYIVVSGFGAKAQWYRNIQVNSEVKVSSGFRRGAPATATAMTQEQSASALERYAAVHPKAWARLRATIEHAIGRSVDILPMVRLRLP
ncbi:nitroreductase family deazaflavin-dependent oxidoreductase [Nocardia sp. KC 131]|uniref:nitroreductase family deazaflavin-dependent oxidoreductase n=1 Tax=Nocardia arseniciresistens TaxID=3392119 RepID=UPI00398E9C61